MRRIAFVLVAAASMVSVVGYTAHAAKQANGQAGPGDLSVFVNGRPLHVIRSCPSAASAWHNDERQAARLVLSWQRRVF